MRRGSWRSVVLVGMATLGACGAEGSGPGERSAGIQATTIDSVVVTSTASPLPASTVSTAQPIKHSNGLEATAPYAVPGFRVTTERSETPSERCSSGVGADIVIERDGVRLAAVATGECADVVGPPLVTGVALSRAGGQRLVLSWSVRTGMMGYTKISRSDDDGVTWEVVNPPDVRAVGLVEAVGPAFWVLRSHIPQQAFFTGDSGVTWAPVPGLPPQASLAIDELDHRFNGQVVLPFVEHSDGIDDDTLAFVRGTAGGVWSDPIVVTFERPHGFIKATILDATTWLAAAGSDLRITRDAGQTWASV